MAAGGRCSRNPPVAARAVPYSGRTPRRPAQVKPGARARCVCVIISLQPLSLSASPTPRHIHIIHIPTSRPSDTSRPFPQLSQLLHHTADDLSPNSNTAAASTHIVTSPTPLASTASEQPPSKLNSQARGTQRAPETTPPIERRRDDAREERTRERGDLHRRERRQARRAGDKVHRVRRVRLLLHPVHGDVRRVLAAAAHPG